jgi:hypothetical protein
MVGYLKVEWHHEFSDEPVLLYSELDGERYEVRKVEVYRDGTRTFANADTHGGTSMLGEVPAPTMERFAELAEFTAVEISRTEFEAEWSAAIDGRGGSSGSSVG